MHQPQCCLLPVGTQHCGWSSRRAVTPSVALLLSFVTLGSEQPLPPFSNCEMGPTKLEAGRLCTPSFPLRSFCPSSCLMSSHTPTSLSSPSGFQAHEAAWSGCSNLLSGPNASPGPSNPFLAAAPSPNLSPAGKGERGRRQNLGALS